MVYIVNTCTAITITLSFILSMQETSLLIECFNYNSNGRHDLIGYMGLWHHYLLLNFCLYNVLICLFIPFRRAEKSISDIEKLHCARKGMQLYLPNNVGNNHQEEVLKILLVLTKHKFKSLLLFIIFSFTSGFKKPVIRG